MSDPWAALATFRKDTKADNYFERIEVAEYTEWQNWAYQLASALEQAKKDHDALLAVVRAAQKVEALWSEFALLHEDEGELQEALAALPEHLREGA